MRRASLAALVESAVSAKGQRVISVPDLIYSLRAALPHCEHTDAELKELVIAQAARHGCTLAFTSAREFEVKPGRPS